ncbi:3'-5' exonuclease [Flavicella sediminum]|uniref:3'-5' exonuclease n=1 Tax=Flavicella sediminum TaxID=2585141 RepID=UPI001121F716|nr:3'-5' exonuclease [Flavicella sediminum]
MSNLFSNLFNKDYPEYWNIYCALFKSKKKQTIKETRFVVFDTETTGFDYKNDRMLCIGATVVCDDRIMVNDGFEVYLKQDVFNPNTVRIHGILKNEKLTTFEESEALLKFIEYIKNSVLVAHHAGFDINMVNTALKRHGLQKLKNKVLDTGILFKRSKHIVNIIDPKKNYSLDEICQELKISVKDRHTAAGDAFITAIAFLKIMSKLNKDGNMSFKDLFINPMNY